MPWVAAVVAVGFAWLALSRGGPWIYLNAATLGLAYSALTTTAIHIMTTVVQEDRRERTVFFDDSGVYPSLNVGFVAIGTGALVGPWLVRLIERWWGCRQGLLYVSASCIVPAVLAVLCERGQFPASPAASARQPADRGTTGRRS